MKLNKFTVSFEEQDMNFLKEFGIFKASSIVRKHYKKHKTPFIYDTYQLARTIAVPRNMLFELTRCAQKHYKLIMLRKKNGGLRYIHSPDTDLKHAQVQILKKILNNIEVSQYATAYIKGKKLKDNASPHINHKYLLKMDITDFFGSITYLQVISSAFNSKMYPVQIGAMLTSLCCLNDVLPQGAPTSPMLSNIVMKNFDDIIGNWCKEKNITYTRYCDDLTFSADTQLYGVYLKVKDMLERRGFEVNESKTKFISNSATFEADITSAVSLLDNIWDDVSKSDVLLKELYDEAAKYESYEGYEKAYFLYALLANLEYKDSSSKMQECYNKASAVSYDSSKPGSLGVTVTELFPKTWTFGNDSEGYVFVDLENGGLCIESIDNGFDAATKLQYEDVIIEINGQPACTESELKSALSGKMAGDTVTVTFYRRDQIKHASVKLGYKD